MKVFWVLRAYIVRIFNKNFKALYLGKPTYIKNLRNLHAATGVGIYPHARIEILNNSYVKIGTHTRIGHALFIDASADVIIGKNCTLSSNVFIATAKYEWGQIGTKGFKSSEIEPKPVQIGNNVFIGINAVIMPGSIIEDGSVIGANTIVKGLVRKKSIFYNEIKSISR